jgi:hypothetical protein
LVALANTTRLSSKKGAHAALSNLSGAGNPGADAILAGRDSLEADSVRQIFFILKEFGPNPRLTSNSLKLATV